MDQGFPVKTPASLSVCCLGPFDGLALCVCVGGAVCVEWIRGECGVSSCTPKLKGGGTNKPWNTSEECRSLRQRQRGDWTVGRDKELGVGEDASIPVGSVHLPRSGGSE